MPAPFLSQLKSKLTATPGNDLSTTLSSKACVALILRGKDMETLELGYIRRAISPNDGWSGQIAFPGGRREDSDEDDFFTACREVREETGIELSRAELLGHIDDIQARRREGLLDFFIRPLVFYIDKPVRLALDPLEVADFFWVPVHHLADTSRRIDFAFGDRGVYPAIDVGGSPPLWGLTYMMTLDLLARL